ncbi:hypothetical protein GGH94_001972 [Coemansia aciculifera]|uniref:Uncharacterized protein n=1 Tax=Coemansia aciculifera TaxID=417176 RepID=A0A9W8IMW3_9FUNG|nr:hypothetical protein GGH94_001972 [Coemansia aciculifera]KAJ2875839.1 hypothetical protein GGH93_001235 [Coemansia aciculifera]
MSLLLRSRIQVSAVCWPRLLAHSGYSQRLYPQQRRAYMGQPPMRQWARPVLYTAGGVALVVLGWPALRFVVIGGMAYGAYRLLRTIFLFRSLSQGPRVTRDDINSSGGPLAELWRAAVAGLRRSVFAGSVSPQLIEQLRVAAETGLRAGIDMGDERLVEVLGRDDGAGVVLGEAMQTEESRFVVNGLGRTRVEVLFPVFVDMRATPVFVQAVGSAVPGVIESASVLARLASGEVAEIGLDVLGQSSPKAKKKKVVDAEYRDV